MERFDIEDPIFLNKIRIKCKITALQLGYGYLYEDFFQDLIRKYLEGSAQKQTVEQSFIDFLRARYGRDPNEDKQKFNRAISFETYSGSCEFDKHDALHIDIDFKKLIAKLPVHLRSVARLYYNWGLTQKEIGQIFDVTESRICQQLQLIEIILQKEVSEKKIKRKNKTRP